MSSKQPEMLDQVKTEEGVGLVVGLPEFDQVEVRFPSKGGKLAVFPVSAVKVVEGEDDDTPLEKADTTAQPQMTYQEARAAGQAPPVDLSQFGDLGGPAPAVNPDAKPKSTLAGMVADGVPLGKNGKPLHGVARTKALAKQRRERED